MKSRKPRQDELELWNKVAQQVTPMERSRVLFPDNELQNGPEPVRPKPTRAMSVPSMGGGKTPLQDNLAPALGETLSAQPVRMDQKAFKQMRRGKMKPDGRIDLHGMTLNRAHTVLTRFVMTSHQSGKRLILVITGKGKHRDAGGPIPVRYGVLRHQVPEWLRLPPLSNMVLQVSEAHQSHGGGGAYYVYLRRSR